MTTSGTSLSLSYMRERLVKVLTWLGFANSALFVASAILVSLGLDYLVELPLAVRAVALCGAVLIVLALVLRTRRRLRHTYPPGVFLETIERKHPEFDGQLLNAIEFGREWKDRKTAQTREAEPFSKALELQLAQRAAREAREALGPVSFQGALDLRLLRRRATWAALAWLGVAVVVVCFPHVFRTWGLRNVFLSTTVWPRSTHFVVDSFEPVLHHPRKAPLSLECWVLGDVPRAVELHIRSDGKEKVRRLLAGATERRAWNLISEIAAGGPAPGEKVEAQKVTYSIAHVLEPFEYYFAGGDNRSRETRVEVHESPRIVSTSVAVTYPEHTGLEKETFENPSRDIRALEGSTMDLRFEVDQQIHEAWLRFHEEERRHIETHTKHAFSHGFVLEESGFLDAGALAGDWHFETDRVRLAFVAYVDLHPQISLAILTETREVTPEGRIAWRVEARDDFGFRDIQLELIRPDKNKDGQFQERIDTVNLAPWDLQREDQEVRVAMERELELKPFSLTPGSRFTLRALAVDNDAPGGFKESHSGSVTFSVLSPEEFRRAMERRLTAVQGRLEELAFAEAALVDDIDAIDPTPPGADIQAANQELAANKGSPGRQEAKSPGDPATTARQRSPQEPSGPLTTAQQGPRARNAQSSSQQESQQSKSAKQARQQAGEQSKSAEQARQQASEQSKSAEQARQQASEQSKSAEQARQQASEQSKSAEQARQRASEQSKSAEQARQQAASKSASSQKNPPSQAAERQKKIAQDLRELAKELDQLASSLEQNRALRPEEKRRLVRDVREPLRDLAEEKLPDSVEELESVRKKEDLLEAKKKVRDIAEKMQQAAENLEGTQKFQDAIDRLRILLKLQGELIRETERDDSEDRLRKNDQRRRF